MNDELNLTEIDLVAQDGSPVHLAYEESGDILEIVFRNVQPDFSLELTEQILLSFNRAARTAAGLTILDFSILATPNEFGPRTFVLSGLEALPVELTETVLYILAHPPVNQFLKQVSYQPTTGKVIPLTYVDRSQALALAAR